MIRKISFLIIGISLIGCSTKKQEKLTIATAANVQFAMAELTNAFEKDTGIPCEIILGSSGQLNAQIKGGAPYDVFVSANMKYPQDLYNHDLTLEKPAIYAYGLLVLWSRNKSEMKLENLSSDSIKKIALANPSNAPYGEAALEVLNNIHQLDQVKNKLVYGESISQVNQFILSGSTDAGFTSRSAVISPELKNLGSWIEVDRTLYKPIEQGIVVIKGGREEAARKFYKFILSDRGKEILKNNGYRI